MHINFYARLASQTPFGLLGFMSKEHPQLGSFASFFFYRLKKLAGSEHQCFETMEVSLTLLYHLNHARMKIYVRRRNNLKSWECLFNIGLDSEGRLLDNCKDISNLLFILCL